MGPIQRRLRPFAAAGVAPATSIDVTVARREDVLSVRWRLRGDLSTLSVPQPAPEPSRMERLWEKTCFELFVAARESRDYWEFNLSPAGHWNVFRFSGYREGMLREPAFRRLPFRIRMEPGALDIAATIDAGKIARAGAPLEIGASAVLMTAAGAASFWALAHSGPRPDFHRRNDFLLLL